MKRNLFYFILVLSAILASCEKETILTIDQTTLSYTDAGGSQTITLTANKPWTASSNQSWCKVSPSGGEEATSSRISISCDANTTYDARNCTVTITCAELTKSISISQATNNGLMLSQTSYEVTKAAQQLNIQVQANVKFSVEVDNGCKDWVKYNTTKGLTTSTVVLDIAENKTYDSREGKVTIKQDGGSLSSTVTIKQSQLDGLFLTTSEYNLSNEKHTLTVEVSTNVEFDVKPEADWVKYVQTKGLNTKQIVLEVAENDTYDQRETKVNVKQKNGDLSGTIIIKQDEKYGILVSQPEYNLSNEAAAIDVEVKYNVDFEVVIPDECKAWIKQVSTKSLNSKTYTFSIAKNESYDIREGSITFKQKKGELSGSVKIVQNKTFYIDASPESDTLTYKGGVTKMTIITNTDFSVSVDDNVDWVEFGNVEKGQTEDGLSIFDYSIIVKENTESGRRIAHIIVTNTMQLPNLNYTIVQEPDGPIQFADKYVETLCIESFDTNHDGKLSYSEAAAVTEIKQGFFSSYKKGITSFDELQYFTGITSIEPYLFNGCSELESVIVPEGVMSINSWAFADCPKLKRLKLPSTLKYILYYSIFSTAIEELILPEGLLMVGESAIAANNIKTITIPQSLTTWDWANLRYCESLESIYGKYSSDDHRAIIIDGVFLSYAPYNLAEYTTPPETKIIHSSAFGGLTQNPKKITFNEGVRELKIGVFEWSTIPEVLVFPSTIFTIGSIGEAKEIYCKATKPPICNFWNENLKGRNLYVPKASVDLYKESDWGVANIIGYDF